MPIVLVTTPKLGLFAVQQVPLGGPNCRMVEEVEELGTELNVAPFTDGGLLEYCPIEVVDALLTEGSIDTRLITEAPSRRISETGRVEPPTQFGGGTSGNFLVATRYDIRSETANAEASARKSIALCHS